MFRAAEYTPELSRTRLDVVDYIAPLSTVNRKLADVLPRAFPCTRLDFKSKPSSWYKMFGTMTTLEKYTQRCSNENSRMFGRKCLDSNVFCASGLLEFLNVPSASCFFFLIYWPIYWFYRQFSFTCVPNQSPTQIVNNFIFIILSFSLVCINTNYK